MVAELVIGVIYKLISKKSLPYLEDSFLCYLFDRDYSYFDRRANSDSFFGFLNLLSEDASTSDSIPWILASSVRRCLDFGLNSSDLSFPCPKMARVRTHSLGFILPLSEEGLCSDSFPPILASSVRRCLDFGLIPSDLSFPCPKKDRVRTHSLGFLLLLSEGASTSDSIPRILTHPVQKRSRF